MFDTIPEWIFGLCLGMAGPIMSNCGLNIQKLSHKQEKLKNNGYFQVNEQGTQEEVIEQPYYKRPVWLVGFLIFIIGELTSGVAMGYASQSFLAVLSSISLVANGFFAYLLLEEKITTRYIKASMIIMLGSIIVVCSASHRDQHYTLDDLSQLFGSWLFIAFLIFVILLASVVICVRQFMFRSARMSAGMASISACFSVLFAKCTVQLIKSSFFGHEYNFQFGKISAWVIVILFSLFATSNIHFINLALSQGPSTRVFPFYYACSTILIVICGVIFFREYSMFTGTQFLIFTIGVSTTIFGVHMLTKKNPRRRRRPEETQLLPSEAHV